MQIQSFSKKESVTANFTFSSFILELPMFRLYGAILSVYIHMNYKTLRSWKEMPSPLQTQVNTATEIQLMHSVTVYLSNFVF
jgi:hypothetical protein